MERPGLLSTNSFEKPLNKKVYSLIPYILRRRSRECWLESRRALFRQDHVIFVHTGGLFGMMAHAQGLSGALEAQT